MSFLCDLGIHKMGPAYEDRYEFKGLHYGRIYIKADCLRCGKTRLYDTIGYMLCDWRRCPKCMGRWGFDTNEDI